MPKEKRYPRFSPRAADAAALQQCIDAGHATPTKARAFQRIINEYRQKFRNGKLNRPQRMILCRLPRPARTGKSRLPLITSGQRTGNYLTHIRAQTDSAQVVIVVVTEPVQVAVKVD
jgi:hypothetical protein